jgi:hypothetical protein
MELSLAEDGSYVIIIDVTMSSMSKSLVVPTSKTGPPKELITIKGLPTLLRALAQSEKENKT